MKVYGTLSTNLPIITPWIASQVKKITDCLFTDSLSVCVCMFAERGKDEIFCWHIPDVFPFRNRRIWNAVTTRFLCSVSTVSARYDLDHDSATNELLAFLNSRLYASSYKCFMINIMKHFSRTSSIHTKVTRSSTFISVFWHKEFQTWCTKESFLACSLASKPEMT